jgi:uncharacterized protein (DUF433 family)
MKRGNLNKQKKLAKALLNRILKSMQSLLNRITMNPEVYKGKPTIRNMRFSVANLLELLASGMSFEEILRDYPYLEREDILACLQYASKLANSKAVLQLSAA